MSQMVDHPAPADSSNPVDTPALPSPPAIPWLATWILLSCSSAVVTAILVAVAKGHHGYFLPSLAAFVCLLAALFDAFTARIPNTLTYPAVLAGLLLNGLAPLLELLHAHSAVVFLGAVGPASSFAGFLICAFLGIVGCLLAGVHGGDLKLLAALGAILGLMQTANVLIVALAVALVYALLNLLFFGGLNTVLRYAAMRLLEALYLRRFQSPLPEDPKTTSHIPMAVPLAIGLLVAQIWQFKSGGGLL
jgi:prepilin peptidase CpaA